jgi:hypothetical protein
MLATLGLPVLGLFLALASSGAIMNVIILGLFLALLVVLARDVIGLFGLPPNVVQIVVVIIGILALMILLRALLPLLGFGSF